MGRPAKNAKDKKTKTSETKESTDPTIDVLDAVLKQTKKHHYNFEESIDYLVSSGSMLMDLEIEGFGPGFHRFVGPTESGKTSEALEVMKNMFATVPNSKGFFVKAEGRLGKEMMARSGIKFVSKKEDWKVGTCFVFETNVFEAAMHAMRELVLLDQTSLPLSKRIKFCFIVDSVDGLCRECDLDKPLGEADKIAGGAVITSAFAKRTSIALQKRGHMAFFLAQLRSKVDAGGKGTFDEQKKDGGTGGNAAKHYPDFILGFKDTYQKDYITQSGEKPSPTNKILGRMVNITVYKSPNEKTGFVISYPVKRGRTNGKSIWIEREVVDFLLMWGFFDKKGGWFHFTDDLKEQFRLYNETIKNEEGKVECPDTIQGMAKVYNFFEQHEDLVRFLIDFCKKTLENAA